MNKLVVLTVSAFCVLPSMPTASADAQNTEMRVPLPANTSVRPPGPDVPEGLRQFSGVWAHGFWSSGLEHVLVVERVLPDGAARVVYAWGDSPTSRFRKGHRRVQGQIADDALSFTLGGGTKVTYRRSEGRLAEGRLDGLAVSASGRNLTAALTPTTLKQLRLDMVLDTPAVPDSTGGARNLPIDSLQRIVPVTVPENAPRILSEFQDWYGVNLRCCRPWPHDAIDIEGLIGDPVIAAASGTARVVTSGNAGLIVSVLHDESVHISETDQSGRTTVQSIKVTTFYVHLLESLIPWEGFHRVKRGQIIGRVGETGLWSGNKPHLHFSVYPSVASDRKGLYRIPLNPHLLWVLGDGRPACFDPSSRYRADTLVLTYPVPCT